MKVVSATLTLLLLASPALAEPKFIASIVPVHAIVSAVMGEAGTPELLLPGRMSEHAASFTATQISMLGKADLVFIIGGGLEAKLTQLSGSEAVAGKVFVELSKAPGIITHHIREGGGWDGEDHEDHSDAFDPHVWLDPENAKAMAQHIAAELGKVDPANKAIYADNASQFAAELEKLSAEIAASLADIKTKPYIVFHDAFQYFEKRFGLNAVGSIADFSGKPPSAKRLKDIRDKLADSRAVCVFREPQYDSKVADTVIEGSNARSGVLDPMGAELAPGAEAYKQILRNIAAGIKACVTG